MEQKTGWPQKTSWIIAVLVGALILMAVIGTTIIRPPHGYGPMRSYRLTADIRSDGHDYIVSQNYGYDCTRSIPTSDGNADVPANCELSGKAMHIDLGARGSLFILMNGWNADHSGFSGANPMVYQLLLEAQRDQQVPLARAPVMVRFRDPTDPETAEIVDPAHLDRSFGPGVAFKYMTVDHGPARPDADDLTESLPWLHPLNGARLSSKPGSPAYQMHGYDFEWPPA
jgi:hypothetical protein